MIKRLLILVTDAPKGDMLVPTLWTSRTREPKYVEITSLNGGCHCTQLVMTSIQIVKLLPSYPMLQIISLFSSLILKSYLTHEIWEHDLNCNLSPLIAGHYRSEHHGYAKVQPPRDYDRYFQTLPALEIHLGPFGRFNLSLGLMCS